MASKKYISIQHIYGTEAELSADNRILLKGQVAFSDDGTQVRQKVGDGVKAYNDLSFVGGSASTPPSRTLTINGDDKDLSADREWRVAQADTGCLTSVGLTANSSTTINIGAVVGYVVDNETDPANPTYTKITYAGETGKTVTTVGSGLSTYVMLGVGGVISFQNTFPTSAQRKAKIWLGKVGHPTGVITTVINEPDFITSPQAFSRDLFQALGPYINNNVYPYANGANLSVNITAGSIRGNGINFVGSVANRQDPDKLAIGPFTPLSFLYRTRTGAGGTAVTLITPDSYDLGGVITPIGGGVNRSTIQYIFCIPGVGFVIQYGQNIYNTLTDAISFIGRESFTVFSNLPDNAILIGVLAVKRTATNLSDETQAHFFNADKLGQIIGATSGVSVGTMQTGYNNSLQPQISVNDTLGSVIYKNARTLDTSTVFEIQNSAGTSTFSVTGGGQINAKGLSVNASTDFPLTIDASGNIKQAGLSVTGSYILNQSASAQVSANYWIDGSANAVQFLSNRNTDTAASFTMRTQAGLSRWRIIGINTETGSNQGYNFALLGSNDAGTQFSNYYLVINRANGSVSLQGGAEALKVSTATGNPDHAYLGFYARTASPTTQSGYVGYNGVATTTLTIANSISNADINITPTGTGRVVLGGVTRLKSYTVATLPAGVQGDTAYVTDATTPTYLGTAVGGGAVKAPVFYNGTTWVTC